METGFHNYVQAFVSLLGLLGGLIAYLISLRIRHDILENNQRIEKEIGDVKDKLHSNINGLRDELIRELGAAINKQVDKVERLERDLSEFSATAADRILLTVNGKYVRTDLHQQSIASIHERFMSMKELIEVNMTKIEEGLDRQIVDLKDRIFHGK